MKKKIIKKKRFVIGIFLLLAVILSSFVVAGTYLYFVQVGKKRIYDIELYSKGYSKTLAEALSGVAELSYRNRNYRSLRKIMRKKIDEKFIDEAFFVKKNGKIIVHSNIDIQKKLLGNIANDEFYYNMDLILMPVTKKNKDLMFFDYNILNKKNRFNRNQRKYLKKYLYADINKLGWLITKGVFVRGKPVGTISFIISKDRIFDFIELHIKESLLILKFALIISFLFSLFVSLVVLFRFRGIQQKDIENRQILLTDNNIIQNKTIEIMESTVKEKKVNNLIANQIVSPNINDDECITIEYLGEIDEDNSIYEDRIEVKNLTEMQVVNIRKDENNLEIKEAIPIKKRVS